MRTILLALALCLPSIAGEKIKVLSYNIHMWQIGVDDLTSLIQKSEADIIGLNEAWSEKHNEKIAKNLGYNCIYGGRAPDKEHPKKAHTVNGFYMPQVLLTKHKIIRSEVFNAMAAKDHERFDPDVPVYRGGTMALLETAKGNRLVVFVLHLHPWGDGDNEKMTSMRLAEIKGIQKKLLPFQNLPTLIIGDFNTLSHHDVEGGWKTTSFLSKHGYQDLFRTVYPDKKSHPGLTCGPGRIDYIFHNKLSSPVSSQVVTKGTFGSKGYDQSDHLAVFGTLELKAK